MKRFVLKMLSILGIRKFVVRIVINRRARKLYGYFLKPNDLVFDIGANIGNRTDFFLSLGTKVISVEPQETCITILKNKFAGNDNVTIVPKGVSDSEGYIELYTSDESSVIATMSDKWRLEGRFSKDTVWNATQKVELTTLDLLIDKYGIPKFCKIDVEGFEKKVIAGLSKKIPVISFEFVKEFFDDVIPCVEMLRKLGPIELNYSLGETMLFQNANFISYEECLKKIRDIKDELAWGDIYVKFVE